MSSMGLRKLHSLHKPPLQLGAILGGERFLVDEDIPRSEVNHLLAAGHDVVSAEEAFAGVEDAELILRAREQNRVLITGDRDVSKLIYRNGVEPPPGVIYGRRQLPHIGPRVIFIRAVWQLSFRHKMTVLSEEHMRQTSLPGSMMELARDHREQGGLKRELPPFLKAVNY